MNTEGGPGPSRQFPRSPWFAGSWSALANVSGRRVFVLAAVRVLECLDDVGRDPATLGDVVPVLLRPLADGLVLFAGVAASRTGLGLRHAGGCTALGPATDAASGGDEVLEALAQLRRVGFVQ